MEIELQARHMELGDRVREYVEKKIGRLDRYLPDIRTARVELSHGSKRSVGEQYETQVTVWVDGSVLRAEEHDPDLFTSIDRASSKLHRQVERYRGKRLDRWHDHTKLSEEMLQDEIQAEYEEAHEGEDERVVRRKRFPLQPMNEEEAVEQLQLLGHDFFLFLHGDTGMVNLVYRRKDGAFGLLEPVIG